MWRLCALAASASLAGQAQAQPCPVENNVVGQDTFQKENVGYQECKKTTDENKLCDCATQMYGQMQNCNYDWMGPWLATVYRDKTKYCAGSSASSWSLSSGSQTSSYASMPSSAVSGEKSGSSNPRLTTPQKLLFGSLLCCLLLICCGAIGAAVFMKQKKKKKEAPQQYYDDYAPQDYEQQQYDQGYGGSPAPYQEPPPLYQEPAQTESVLVPELTPATTATTPLIEQNYVAPPVMTAPIMTTGVPMTTSYPTTYPAAGYPATGYTTTYPGAAI